MEQAKRSALSLSIAVGLGLFALSLFLVWSSYQRSKEQITVDLLDRLFIIANTSAMQISGDDHERLLQAYKQIDDPGVMQDTSAQAIRDLLKEIKSRTGLEQHLYTLVLDSSSGKIQARMGLVSKDEQYYLHEYIHYPDELVSHFAEGKKLAPYTDEHGVWLSAFAPIKNSKGQTVAVIQADQDFNRFQEFLFNRLTTNILISLAGLVAVMSVVLLIVRKIVKEDGKKNQQLVMAHKTMEHQHKRIKDSINYAQRIQVSLIPNPEQMAQDFQDFCYVYLAKDVVSGDFPWYLKRGDDIYLAAVDCTGHGVPGAMVSFIGHFLLNEINGHRERLATGEVLDKLNDAVVKTLNQEKPGSLSRDGMDVGLCRINRVLGEVEFSGAHRPLLIERNGEVETIKGTRKGIGGEPHPKLICRKFDSVLLKYEPGDRFYLFSDGFPDQVMPNSHKKIGSKGMKKLVADQKGVPMRVAGTQMKDYFINWKSTEEQLDDVLLIGFQPS